jgi:hypothetical protein
MLEKPRGSAPKSSGASPARKKSSTRSARAGQLHFGCRTQGPRSRFGVHRIVLDQWELDRVLSCFALSGLGGFSFGSDPQGVALGFPVSAPSGRRKSATPKLAKGAPGEQSPGATRPFGPCSAPGPAAPICAALVALLYRDRIQLPDLILGHNLFQT